MISYIEGKIIFRGEKFIVIKTGGVGFKVFVLPDLNLEDNEIKLFTYLSVREDALVLYGFLDYKELELFELLISISGIGPKAGLGILSLTDTETIKVAIVKNDASVLTRVSGIGKKTAERVILELKNKISISDIGDLENKNKEISEHSDAIDALISLGYSAGEAKNALSKISPEIKDIGERVRMALREMGKK